MSSDLISIELADTLDVDISGTLIKGDDGFSPIINITQLPTGIKIVTTDVDKTSEGEVLVSKDNVVAALGYVPADVEALQTKVDKVDGKSLSTNDFTNEFKDKLDNIEYQAEVNVQSDWSETNVDSDAYILNKPEIYLKSETDTLLQTKVDKVDGKSLVYDAEIARLANVTNYDDSNIKNEITTITQDIADINEEINQLSKITFQLNSNGDLDAIIQM